MIDTLVDLCYEQKIKNDQTHLYYFENELLFDFDNHGKLEAIEFLGGYDGLLNPVVYNQNVFEVEADMLMETLLKKNNGNINNAENECCISFLNIQIGLYRPYTSQSIIGSIKEMLRADHDIDNLLESIKYDIPVCFYWQTILLGREGYYKHH